MVDKLRIVSTSPFDIGVTECQDSKVAGEMQYTAQKKLQLRLK
jgi:hypothetical protein